MSHFILAIVTFVGVMVHIVTGTFHHGITFAIFLAIGVITGARVGALLSTQLQGKIIIHSLAVAISLVALRYSDSVTIGSKSTKKSGRSYFQMSADSRCIV